MNHTYKNLVFSKHALARLKDRTLTVDHIYQTVKNPDKQFAKDDSTKFIRTLHERKIHVVAAPIENHRWLIVSAWVRGEEDPTPIVWQLLTTPFKLIWWLLTKIFHWLTNRFTAKTARKK